MKPTKLTHGGSRKGAGRPKKEPTVTLSYRVPKKKAAELNVKIKAIIAKLSNGIYYRRFRTNHQAAKGTQRLQTGIDRQ